MKSIPEMSADTRAVVDYLRKETEPVVPYAKLNELTGRSLNGKHRYILISALKHLLANDGLVYGAVRGVGIKRLNDTEIVAAGSETLPRIRRAARRGIKRLTSVQDFNALKPDDQTKHNALVSVLGVMAHAAKPKSLEKIEERVQQAKASLPLKRTLEAFA